MIQTKSEEDLQFLLRSPSSTRPSIMSLTLSIFSGTLTVSSLLYFCLHVHCPPGLIMWCLHFCPIHRLTTLLSGGTKKSPSLLLSRGFQHGPLPGEALKGWGRVASSHSHGRTTQGHQSKVSPLSLTRPAQPGWAAASQGAAAPQHIHTHSTIPKHRSHPGSRAPKRPTLHR